MALQLIDNEKHTTAFPFLLLGSNANSVESQATDRSELFLAGVSCGVGALYGLGAMPSYQLLTSFSPTLSSVSTFDFGSTAPSPRSTLFFSEIRSQGRVFHLNPLLQIDSSNLDGYWCYESKPLSLCAFGTSRQEALDSFMEDFSVLWDAIAQAPDESLTGDAIAVKHTFQKLVGAVTPE